MNEYEFWDLGEHQAIRPSKASLHKIMDAVIRLHGKIHDTYCMELDRKTGEYQYPTSACSVLFRISLPEGKSKAFETMTGFELTKPPKIGVN